MGNGRYSDLLKNGGFQAFLWTQFLGAFNDNVSKWIVTLFLIDLVPGQGSLYAGAVGSVFILPFLLFSSYAGRLADLRSKRDVMVALKLAEVLAMAFGWFALSSGRKELLLCIPFLMGLQSTFFSPAKYGYLPELLPEKDLSRANGLVEMTTFAAIILGTSLGGFLYQEWKGEPGRLNLVLVGVAVAGFVSSWGIPRTPPSGATGGFRWNPFGEVLQGLAELRRKPPLWLTVLGTSSFWLLGAFLLTAVAPLGKETMGLDERHTSLLETFLALGIGAGSLLAGKLSGDKVELGLVPLGSLGMGAGAVAVWAFSPSWAGVSAAFVLLGYGAGLFIVPLNSLLQQKADKEGKGRILATNNFLNAIGMLLGFGLLSLLGGPAGLTPDRAVLVAGALCFLLTAYLLTILPDFLIRFALWVLTHTIYRIRIRGQEHIPSRGPALLVCNHVSLVDGLLVGACLQRFVRFMVWKPYYDHPAFHWLLRRMKAIPVDPRGRSGILECLERAREELRAGHVVCIFAEGAISRTGNLLPFKRGFERIMEGLEVPIVPVHLDGVWGSIFSFTDGRFVTKVPRKIPYPVTVSFGRPMPAASRAERVREAVQELGSEAMDGRRLPHDTLPARFVRMARRNLRAFAIADSGGARLSYGRVLAGALLLAAWLRRHARDQDHVGLLLPASAGGAIANLATSLTGKIPVNLNFTAGKEATDYAVEQCGIRTILTSKVFLRKANLEERPGMVHLEDLMGKTGTLARIGALLQAWLLPAGLITGLARQHPRRASDVATVIYSSGSTGTPKGVMLTHHNVLSNIESLGQVFQVTRRDRVLGVLPFFHSFGFTGTLWFPLLTGAGAVYHPNPLDAKSVGELCLAHRATIFMSTPTFYGAYLRKCSREEFSSLRIAVVGAEKLRETLAAEFREKFGIELMEGYGSTEMAPVVCLNVPDVAEKGVRQQGLKPGTVGQPLPGVSVRLVDPDDGAPVAPGAEGLLLVKGPNRMLGYKGQPERTAEVLRDGWYVTGDLARIDDDGFVTITDRLSRFSKIGGEMVPHGKVEEALGALLGEHAVAVTALPDEQKGERLVAFHTHPGMGAEELWERLSGGALPKLWVPKKDCIRFVEKLPLLGSGKLDLKALKRLAAEEMSKG